jgi:hypothetical protein
MGGLGLVVSAPAGPDRKLFVVKVARHEREM